MKDEGKGSWSSMVGAGVVLYWCVFFAFRFIASAGKDSLVLLLIFCLLLGLVIRYIMRWVARNIVTPALPDKDGESFTISSSQPLPFFVKGQVRRRKLDVTRSSNFIKDSIDTKRKRQLSGILRTKKKRGGK